jgi:hypothetical protein
MKPVSAYPVCAERSPRSLVIHPVDFWMGDMEGEGGKPAHQAPNFRHKKADGQVG